MKILVLLNHSHNFGFLDAHGDAFGHCDGCGQTLRLANQAALAQEFVRSENRDNGLLSLLRNDGDFDLSFFDIENQIRRIALRKKDLLLWMAGNDAPLGHRFQEHSWIEFHAIAHGGPVQGWPNCLSTVTGFLAVKLPAPAVLVYELDAGGLQRPAWLERDLSWRLSLARQLRAQAARLRIRHFFIYYHL